MYIDEIKLFLQKELNCSKNQSEIKTLINSKGYNISTSTLNRIINKLVAKKILLFKIETKNHPKKFPVKYYQLNKGDDIKH